MLANHLLFLSSSLLRGCPEQFSETTDPQNAHHRLSENKLNKTQVQMCDFLDKIAFLSYIIFNYYFLIFGILYK